MPSLQIDHKEAQRKSLLKEDPCLREYYKFQEHCGERIPPAQLIWYRAWELAIKSITPDNDDRLFIGWEGYYVFGQGQCWFWCRVIAFDDGEPVIRTRKGNYHRRPRDLYTFAKVPPKGVALR